MASCHWQPKTNLDGTESQKGAMGLTHRPIDGSLSQPVEKAQKNDGDPDAILKHVHQQRHDGKITQLSCVTAHANWNR